MQSFQQQFLYAVPLCFHMDVNAIIHHRIAIANVDIAWSTSGLRFYQFLNKNVNSNPRQYLTNVVI